LAREAVSTRRAVDPTVKAKPKRLQLPHERPLSDSRIERDGLRAGTSAPTFRLPDVYDRTVALEDYRGQHVLLVFSDPRCQPCDELAPRLARLHTEHGDSSLALILIGRGDAEENRRKVEQFGIKFPVVVQEKWRLSKKYGIFMTPVAFLVGEDGVIARDVVIGPDAILALAQEELTRTYPTLLTSSGKDGDASRGTD
jgi:peroxiredoxin